MIVKIKKLTKDAIIPTKNNEDDAGWDCYINGFIRWNDEQKQFINYDKDMKEFMLLKGSVIGCKLGFALEIPVGYYMQLIPKSGLAAKYGITVVNSHAGYRGEAIAFISNLKNTPYIIKRGDKIAQLILRKEVKTELIESDELNDSKRGKKGFGSSGR